MTDWPTYRDRYFANNLSLPKEAEAVFRHYLADMELRGKGRSWRISALTHIGRFLDVSPHVVSEDPTVADLKAFFRDLREDDEISSDGTVANYFLSVKDFLRYLKIENRIDANPYPEFSRYYLNDLDTSNGTGTEKQLASVGDVAEMVSQELDPRVRALVLLLHKTGVRRETLHRADVDWVDLEARRMDLADPCDKRKGHRVAFFDDETAGALERWLEIRPSYRNGDDSLALFFNERGARLSARGIHWVFTQAAERVGLHDPDAPKEARDERYSPHNARVWFTEHLQRNGMHRSYVQYLRGDSMDERMTDYYRQIDPADVQAEYATCMPRLGVN